MGSIASIGFKDTSHTLGFSLYVLTGCPPLTQFPLTRFPLTQLSTTFVQYFFNYVHLKFIVYASTHGASQYIKIFLILPKIECLNIIDFYAGN